MAFILKDLLPELAQELEELLMAEKEPDLAMQVSSLQIVDRCRCGDDFCSTIYTESKPKGSYGPGHQCIELEPNHGMLILDVVNNKIAAVEILYRDEIRKVLLTALP
jgi:hypothetical protein